MSNRPKTAPGALLPKPLWVAVREALAVEYTKAVQRELIRKTWGRDGRNP